MKAEAEEYGVDGEPLEAVAYHRQLAKGWATVPTVHGLKTVASVDVQVPV